MSVFRGVLIIVGFIGWYFLHTYQSEHSLHQMCNRQKSPADFAEAGFSSCKDCFEAKPGHVYYYDKDQLPLPSHAAGYDRCEAGEGKFHFVLGEDVPDLDQKWPR